MASAWNFNESSGNVIDYVGNSSFALIANVARTADAAGKSGLTSDRGLTQAASARQAVSPMPAQSAQRTIACWTKQTASIGAGWATEFNNAGTDTGVFGFLWLSGTVRFRVKDSSNAVTEISVTEMADSAWHHLCGSYDGTNLRFFIDGVLSTRTLAFTGPIWVPASAAFYMLDTTGSPLTIDDARVLDVAVTTESAVVDLMNRAVSPPGRMLALF
jgi:hypothetical protein